MEVLVPLSGLIDIAAEKARLAKEARKADKEIETIKRKLDNPSFIERAPAEVVEEQRARLVEETARSERLQGAMAALE